MWDEIGRTLYESTVRVLSQFASLLPGVLALFVAVLLSLAIAWVVSYALRHVLERINFDERLHRLGLAGIAEWSPRESPALLVTRLAGWSIVVLGCILGLAAFDVTLTSALALDLFTYIPKVIEAAVLMVVGVIVARYLARNVLIGAVNMNLQYARLLSAGMKWMIMVLAVAMALDSLQVGRDIVHLAFGILFGGIVFALALAVGLGSKELVSRSLERESERANEERFRHV
jgi:hypothetical protein